MAGMHDGHRQRMRDRLQQGGLDHFAEHEVLEWLLFHTIPRGDTNSIAHKLIDAFGSLAGVLEANSKSLCTVDGVGESTALFLSNYLSVYKCYHESSHRHRRNRFSNLEDIADYFQIKLLGEKEEYLHALLLGSNYQFIQDEIITQGSLRNVQVNMRQLTEVCLNTKAAYVALAHNHPSNILLPSKADVSATMAIAEILCRIEVRLLDHMIVGVDDYVSMASSAEYSYLFNL